MTNIFLNISAGILLAGTLALEAKCVDLSTSGCTQDNYTIVQTEHFSRAKHNTMESVHAYTLPSYEEYKNNPCTGGY